MSTMFQDMLGGGGAGPAPDSEPDSDPDELLSTAIDALTQYIQHSGSDDVDTSTAAACLAKLQTIKANVQKQDEAASGTTPAHKAMARTVKSLASQVHGGGGGY